MLRTILLSLLTVILGSAFAQPYMACSPNDLPPWMQQLAWDTKPVPCALPKREPLHSNSFIGRWSIQKTHGNRFDFWSDKQRVVIQEFSPKGDARRTYFIDLAANILMKASVEQETKVFQVVDLHVPQVGYFREVWSDSVRATGKAETILGTSCKELLGTDGNDDTTYYWRTDKHPTLFADLRVWAPWLCREGELEFLTALCEEPAGASLKAAWPKRQYGPEAGSIGFLSITPGASPMPQLVGKPGPVVEDRFLWNNNSGIGTLPAWMRAYVSKLPQEPLPAQYTPAPEKRDIPDNKFIGTLTAETPTMIIGMPDKKTGRDTTHRLAKYSYWADARRAVLIMDDPDDEGYLFYAVDLDADVVMASHNEMHSHVVPKLYINTLERVGLVEFGNGLELDFQPQEKFQTIAGKKCELHIAPERSLRFFWFPTGPVVNPIFDMKNWMVMGMAQKMQDLMYFGAADKPMPMAVMGTKITSYKPGKAAPPVVDLGYYRVRDERLEQRRRREDPEEIPVRVEEITSEGSNYGVTQEPGYDVAVPDMDVEGTPNALEPPPVQEGRWEDVRLEPEPMVVPVEIDPDPPAPDAPSGPPAALSPYLQNVLTHPVNKFIGTATLRFKRVYEGKTMNWTVKYASTRERSVLVSHSDEPLPSVRTSAVVIDRKTGEEATYTLRKDSTVHRFDRRLRTAFNLPATQVLLDSTTGRSRTILDRTCEHRVHQSGIVRRDAWVDPKTPSIFMDLFGARKGWDGIDHILHGYHLGIAVEGMPLSEDLVIGLHDPIQMRVIDLKPGPVDPKVFTITRDTWSPK